MIKRRISAKITIIFGSVSLLLFSFFPISARALTVNPIMELEGDPGTTISTTLKITNEERESHTFYVRYENFTSQDETGNPIFSPRVEDLAAWFRTPDHVVLGPGESWEMPVQVEIPANADPGGHYAAIFFLNQPPSVENEESQVALASKLGSLVLLRVHGDFPQGGNIIEFGTTGKQKFFTWLPIQFYYRFQNTGDDHLKPIGDIQIKNLFGRNTKILNANPQGGSVLPKSIRKFTSVWLDGGGLDQAPTPDLPKVQQLNFWDSVKFEASHFMIGRYTANLKIGFGSNGAFKTDHAQYTFYIIPWHLLVIVLPILVILLLILRWIIKRYNRYIISQSQRR